MVITDLELRRKMAQAAASGRYLVLVSYLNEKDKTIQHFFKSEKFPREEIANCLNKYAEMLDPEVNGVAEDNS